MAVKSSKSLIDDDFDDFIRRKVDKVDECSPSDEEESSSGDSSDDE